MAFPVQEQRGAAQVRGEATLTIRVEAPRPTPDSATVYVTGNLPQLGLWRPNGLRLTSDTIPLARDPRGSNRLWSAHIRAPKGTAIELKITLGQWEEEAVYTPGETPGNTRLILNKDTTITLAPVTWRHLDTTARRIEDGITGTVRYHRGLRGKGLNYPRDVIVWLPPSYERDTTQRYPVLYMHDGQNAFDPRTSFGGHDWRVDEVADSLIRLKAMQEIIVVGIGNSPARALEYSDTALGRSYLSFVVDQLKPMIDRTYRTKPDRSNTAVMGSSMGGLISFLFIWWRPDVFSKAACLSSAFLWRTDRILREVEQAQPSRLRAQGSVRIYLDCGTVGAEARLRPGFERMRELLEARGLVEGRDLMAWLQDGAEHNEQAWAGRIWRPLEFLFPLTE